LFLFLFEECTHDNPTAIEWWSKIAWKKAKDQFIEYIHRPFTIQNELIDGLELEKTYMKKKIYLFYWTFLYQFSVRTLSNVLTKENHY
jgi:hypothetical protein